jgi:acetyl/propionyl-CoA carboxylase alpha subunit
MYVEQEGVVTAVPLTGVPLASGSPAAGRCCVFEAGEAFHFEQPDYEAHHDAEAGSGSVAAPMPGRIIAVHVEVGQAVTKAPSW